MSMNGVLVHGTSLYFKHILKDGSLKPQTVTKAKYGNGDYEGGNIFFELAPEDINLKNNYRNLCEKHRSILEKKNIVFEKLVRLMSTF